MLAAPKLLAFTLVSFIFLFLVSSLNSALAQEGIPFQAATSTNYGAAQQASFSISKILGGIGCQFVIFSGCTIDQYVAQTNKTQTLVYNGPPGGGAIGALTLPMMAMYANPPTSSRQYLADVVDGFGIVDPAHAQVSGSGDSIIQPVKQLWGIIRNMAFLIYIVIFLVIGFMIMFRQKVNPQTVISVQGAIPGLVIGLLLINFSYFISAFIVDLSFVGMQLVGRVFTGIDTFGGPQGAQQLANNSNLFDFWASSAFRGENFGAVLGGIVKTVPGGAPTATLVPAAIGAAIAAFMVPGAGLIIGGAALLGAAAPLIISAIIPVILIIALAIQFLKLLLKLLNSYIMILVTTILSPMFILMSTVPGQNKTLGLWWRNLLGHTMTFPAVFAGFLFAGMILNTKPEVWTAAPPLFGGLSIDLLRLAISYGIVLGLPAIPDIVKKAIGAQDLGAIGQTGIAGFAGAFGLTQKTAADRFNKSSLSAPFKIRQSLREAELKERAGVDIHNEAARIRENLAAQSQRGRLQGMWATLAGGRTVQRHLGGVQHLSDAELRGDYQYIQRNAPVLPQNPTAQQQQQHQQQYQAHQARVQPYHQEAQRRNIQLQ